MTFSIRARLMTWYGVVTAAALAVGVTAIASVHTRLGLHRIDDELARFEKTIEAVMSHEFGEGLDLEGAAAEASSEVISPDMSVVLASRDGRRLAAWGEAPPESWTPALSPDGSMVPRTADVQGQRVRVVEHAAGSDDRAYRLAVMAPLARLERERNELLEALVFGVFASIAVAAIGGWLVGRRALQPLTAMAEQSTSITARDVGGRLRAPHPRDELGRLAASFNALLDRLSAALQFERRFMEEASHQLRTPVSVLRTTAQVTLRRDHRAEQEYRESMTIVAEQSARLTRLVDAMFLLSQGEASGRVLRREPLYLGELVAECVRGVSVLGAERGVRIVQCGDEEAQYSGDDELLRHMIVNVLENAVRYTPDGGTVTAEVVQNADQTCLRIRDQGPGIPPQDRERVFQRFVRLDDHSPGAGLGLAMARWVAEAHGGRLTVESSDVGGACFAAALPRRDDATAATACQTPAP